MSEQTLNLRKDIIINLKKNTGLRGLIAAVEFCLDYSGSTRTLYHNGAMQRVIERILPLGLAFDDNKSVGMKIFDDGFRSLPDITLANYRTYIQDEILSKRWDMGTTNYAPVLNQIVIDHIGIDILHGNSSQNKGLFGGLFNKTAANTAVTPKNLTAPVYIIFITDGNCDDKGDTETVIREASKYGIFFQFIGIGNLPFTFLKKLDTMPGRVIDNANFFEVDDLDEIDDTDLYNRMMKEFPSWINDARKQSLIPG